MVFVIVELATELPDAQFGSFHGLNLPVIWGSEMNCSRLKKGDERGKRRDKVEYCARFCLQPNPNLCMLFDLVRCSCHKDSFLQGQCLGDVDMSRSLGFVMDYLV